MVKNAKGVKQAVIEVQLPHGFNAIQTVAMELDVLRLKKAITPRMDSLRKAIGANKAEKLAGFCVECLPEGETAYVTVVAKNTNGENGHSYLCLCPCGGSTEVFVINGTFLRAVYIKKDSRNKSVLIVQPQQKKIAHATR